MTTVTVSDVGSNSAVMAVSGIPGTASGVQYQLATRPDFAWCVAPIFQVVAPGSSIDDGVWGGVLIDDGIWSFPMVDDGSFGSGGTSLAALNQLCSYYLRARAIYDSQPPDDWSAVAAFRTTASSTRITTPANVMIEPAILVVPEPVIAWEAATPVAGYPVENLGVPSPVAFRSKVPDGDNHIIRARMSGAPIDTVALLRTNIPEGALILLKAGQSREAVIAGSGAVFGPFPARASAGLPGRDGYHGLIRLPAPAAYPFWQIDVLSGLFPGGVMHADHVVFGLARVSKNHAIEKTETGSNLGTIDRTRSGMLDRVDGYRMRLMEFELQMMTEAQYELLYSDLQYRVNDTVLVVPNSKSGAFLHDRIGYGDLGGGRVVNPVSPRYTRSFSVNSII